MDSKGRVIYFVPTNANPNGEEIMDLMMKKEDVSFVAKYLHQTNIVNQKLVVEDVQIFQETQKTYCVTIPNNECFSLANGIVVSNCRYALEDILNNTVDYSLLND